MWIILKAKKGKVREFHDDIKLEQNEYKLAYSQKKESATATATASLQW